MKPAQKTVLVVEDEEDHRELLVYALTREGFRVVACADGPQALEAAKTAAPDLLLVDLCLPGMGACELLQKLASQGTTAPAVAVTAWPIDAAMVPAIRMWTGLEGVIPKPFEVKALCDTVRRLVG